MLQKLIDDALQKEQDSRKDRVRSGMWSPSSFGRCFRYQYWNRKNEPISNPVDARTLRKFKAGKLFHDFVEKLLPEHQTEVLVKKDDILGYADVVFTDKVIDVKSVHSYDFKRFWSTGYDVYKEKDSYWRQVATYSWILGKKWCGLFFISKDDLITEQYEALTEKFIPSIKAELKILRDYWDKKELPEGKPIAYGGKECEYCSYRTKCDSPNKKLPKVK